MLSYKKKNYALLGYDGQLKFKGSSLVSRSSERFGRAFVREAIRLLLDENIQGLHDLYLATRDRIVRHGWEGVEDFQRTETLKDTLKSYREAVKSGKRTRSAAYELAARRQKETGQPVRKGDRLRYYIAGEGTSAPSFEQARLAEKWDPAAPDENTAVYLARLDQLTRRFEPFSRPTTSSGSSSAPRICSASTRPASRFAAPSARRKSWKTTCHFRERTVLESAAFHPSNEEEGGVHETFKTALANESLPLYSEAPIRSPAPVRPRRWRPRTRTSRETLVSVTREIVSSILVAL